MTQIHRHLWGLATAALVLAGVSVAAAPPAMQRTGEDALKNRIEYGLETSPIVKKYNIKTRVNGSDVILSGDVATQQQKDEAARIAKIAGASGVQNSLVVDAKTEQLVDDRIRAGRTKTGEKLDDKWITAKVKWFMTGEDMLKGTDIDVDVDDGVVKLKGNVRDQATRERAVTLARDTEGVLKVIDELKVR
jgi:osmotically-inducible protein OsmY